MNDTERGVRASKFSLTRIQFLCLIIAAFLEFLMIFIGKMNGRALYKPFHNGLLVCCLVFCGTMILQTVKNKTRYPLALSVAMAIWFTLIQLQHYRAGMTTQPYGMFLSSYLLAFPFAVATRDTRKQIGLKTAAFLYIAATMVLVLYTGLLVTDSVPSVMVKRLFWNNLRLTVIHHPNITARAFMISIAFCLGFVFQFSRRWVKGVFLAAAALMFSALSLTSSRAAILLTCALCGGVIFLAICQRHHKAWIRGAAAGLAAALCLFLFSQQLFQWNANRLVDSGTLQQTAVARMPGSAVRAATASQTPYRVLFLSNSEQMATETENAANGSIVAEDGAMYYYENGVRTYAGLIRIDGEYYYVNSKCMVVTGRYDISRTNDLMEAGTYLFDETGRMIPMKNGILEEDGVLYYYATGEKYYAGLIEIDGDYYYANSEGIIVTGRYYVYKDNGLMEPGQYVFDETGKLVTDPALAASVLANMNNTAAQNSIMEDFSTLNGRTKIWQEGIGQILKNPSILWQGCDNTAVLVSRYGVSHTHNSWLEILARLGLPGLLISLLFTLQAVWACVRLLVHGGVDLWKKTIALLVLCLLASGAMEPTLFFTEEVWHYVDFMFFLCLGYLIPWRKELAAS